MKELKRKFTLRTALTAALTLALVASATVFMAASAAENVTPSDVSGGDMPKSSASHTEMSLTDVSPTDLPDAAISRAVIRAIRSQIIAPAAYNLDHKQILWGYNHRLSEQFKWNM